MDIEHLLSDYQKTRITSLMDSLMRKLEIESTVVKGTIGYDEVMLTSNGVMERILTVFLYNKKGQSKGFALLRDTRVMKAAYVDSELNWIIDGSFNELLPEFVGLRNTLIGVGGKTLGTVLTLTDPEYVF